MGLLDVLNGMQNGPRGPSTPSAQSDSGGGMSPMTMAILALLAWKGIKHFTGNQAGAAQILGSPLIALIMLLFIIASTWHMKIGMQVVIEDYVHNEKLKLASIMANNFFSVAVALASIYAILKLSSGV